MSAASQPVVVATQHAESDDDDYDDDRDYLDKAARVYVLYSKIMEGAHVIEDIALNGNVLLSDILQDMASAMRIMARDRQVKAVVIMEQGPLAEPADFGTTIDQVLAHGAELLHTLEDFIASLQKELSCVSTSSSSQQAEVNTAPEPPSPLAQGGSLQEEEEPVLVNEDHVVSEEQVTLSESLPSPTGKSRISRVWDAMKVKKREKKESTTKRSSSLPSLSTFTKLLTFSGRRNTKPYQRLS